MIKITTIMPIQCLSLCSFLFFSSAHANTLDQRREHAVEMVRSGQVVSGLNRLQALLAQFPTDQKLIADYLVLAYGQPVVHPQDLYRLTQQIQPKTFPAYAQVSAIKVLRDAKQYAQAKAYLARFQPLNTQASGKVWHAVLEAESGQAAAAKTLLKNLQWQQLSADDLSLLSYTYRILNMPVQALQAAEAGLKKQSSIAGHEQYVLSLMLNGKHHAAENYLLQQQLAQSHPRLLLQVKQHQFSTRIQNAVQAYKTAQLRSEYATAYTELDAVLADMAAHEPQVAADAELQHAFYADYLYALGQRKRHQQVLKIVQQQHQPIANWPAYVRHAIADAYLATRQPELAEPVYLSLFQEKNYADYTVYAGLYYAYIEQEKFKQADQLIQDMDRQLPRYRYSEAKGVDRSTHEDREQYLALKGLNYAYRNEHAKAEQYFETLVSIAPNNLAYQNNLAQIQRWREKPLTSQQTLEQWNGLDQVSQITQINQMQNAQALNDIRSWRQLNQTLLQTAADDTGVQLSRKELKDRDHFSIQHEIYFSESRSDQEQLLNRLKGSEERTHWTRLNSPWLNEHYQVFIDHQHRQGRYEDGTLDNPRLGLGVAWSKDRKYASLLLSQSLDEDRVGAALDWSHWLNDHWQYHLAVNTQADIPLQAMAKAHEGQSYRAGFNWQANESRKAGAQFQLTDIDDGNTRQEYQAYFSQQFYQAPHHLSRATLSGYYGKNKPVAVDYFNPESSHSLELKLEHDWMTWRRYEQHFNQHFELTLGTFGQKDYSNEPIYNLLYRHDWHVSRTWKLHYGIGWGSHPYDGKTEEKTYAVFGFEGRF